MTEATTVKEVSKMPFYHTEEEERYEAFAALPLPEAAGIIDVRQTDVYDTSLLDYLVIDVADLATELRLQKIPRWRHLSECIDFLRLDTTPPYATLHEFSDFVLTTRG